MISEKEYYLMIADQFPAPKVSFDEVDTNGSGFISYPEFAAFLKKQNPGILRLELNRLQG